MPTGITDGTVNTLLQYVDGAIPPYLLSKPLLQRHHFLAIPPDNPIEYLAWPSPDRSQAVTLLLRSHPIPPAPLCINYTADQENLLAHVRISPELRLVFLWDPNQSTWLYHNLALMPFPPDSYSTFNDALMPRTPIEQSYSLTAQGDDDDLYWNSYGTSHDSDHPSISADSLDANPSSEDAYWAQYSTVQGSGDSTLPSPLPTNKKFHADLAPERVFVPSDNLQIYHVKPYNPLEPPSPEVLSRRLAALSPESGAAPLPASPPLFDDSPTTPSPQLTEVAPVDSRLSPSSSPPQPPVDEVIVVDPAALGLNDTTEGLLRDNIKAMFRLWRLARREEIPTDLDKDIFLATVQQALDQL